MDAKEIQALGGSLQGMGAWFAGQGPQYQVAESDRLKTLSELDDKRKQAMVEDFRSILVNLKAGKIGPASQVLQSRLEAITQLGGDPSDTAEINRMIQEGRVDEAIQGLQMIDDMAVTNGKLPSMADKVHSVKDGQAIYQRADGSTYAGAVEGYVKPEGELSNFRPDDAGNMWGWNGKEWVQTDTGGATFTSGGGTNVQVTMPGQTDYGKEQEELAKLRIQRLGKMQDQADSALEQNVQLDQLSALDVESGWGTGAKTQTARVLNAVWPGSGDVVMKSVSAQEAFAAVSEELVSSKLNSATGPQTDQDAQRIRSTVATLGKTPDANAFIIASARATNDRKIEQRNFYESYFESKGSLAGVDTEWAKYKLSTPMLSDPRYVRNKQTGLPIFYNEFARAAKQGNPQLSEAEIVDKWRELNQPKGGEK